MLTAPFPSGEPLVIPLPISHCCNVFMYIIQTCVIMSYTPEDVGHRFVKQYYEALNSKPETLHVYACASRSPTASLAQVL